MKKLLASLLVLAMCAPAMALTLSTSKVDNVLTISYDLAEGEVLRGLALTVTNVSGDGVVAASTDYTVPENTFNTFMDFAADVDNVYTAVGQGHPFAMITPNVAEGQYEAAFPAASFALSLGYLDEDQDEIKGEGITEDGAITVTFTGAVDTEVAVALDTFRGGAVGDNLVIDDAGLVNQTLFFTQPKAIKDTAPFFAAWQAWGEPACWAFKKQCRGDVDGGLTFGKPVLNADLALFKNAYNKTDDQLRAIPNGICADLDHTPTFGKRVLNNDLAEFKKYYNLADSSVPVCDSTHYNFWTN